MLSKGTSVGSKAARARRQAASGLKAASAAEGSAQTAFQLAEATVTQLTADLVEAKTDVQFSGARANDADIELGIAVMQAADVEQLIADFEANLEELLA